MGCRLVFKLLNGGRQKTCYNIFFNVKKAFGMLKSSFSAKGLCECTSIQRKSISHHPLLDVDGQFFKIFFCLLTPLDEETLLVGNLLNLSILLMFYSRCYCFNRIDVQMITFLSAVLELDVLYLVKQLVKRVDIKVSISNCSFFFQNSKYSKQRGQSFQFFHLFKLPNRAHGQMID